MKLSEDELSKLEIIKRTALGVFVENEHGRVDISFFNKNSVSHILERCNTKEEVDNINNIIYQYSRKVSELLKLEVLNSKYLGHKADSRGLTSLKHDLETDLNIVALKEGQIYESLLPNLFQDVYIKKINISLTI